MLQQLLYSLFRFPRVRLKLPPLCGCASFCLLTLMALSCSLSVINLSIVFGVIVLHTGAFQHFYLLINQFGLTDLHKPPNLESYGWWHYFKLSWYFVLMNSFIVKHLSSKILCIILLPLHQQNRRSTLQVLMLIWFAFGCERALHPREKTDKTSWISFKQMQPVPLPCEFIHSAIGLLLIVCVNGEFLVVQSKSSEMCQHVTGSGRCPAIQTDINGFLFLLSPSSPNPSLHLSIHASIFCSSPFFSQSLPPSHHPGSHAPLCGPVWPFLPPLTHTYAHLPVPYHTHTDWTTHVHDMKTNASCPSHNCMWAALSFLHRDKLADGLSTQDRD